MRIDLRTAQAFNFPDGQPHVSLTDADFDPKLGPVDSVEVIARITSSDDLMRVLMAKDILDRRGFTQVRLRISYLMGARMDRPINEPRRDHPFTLRVITNVLNNAGFKSISVFDPHSDVSTALLNAYTVSPNKYVSLALNRANDPVVCIPDAGAIKRTGEVLTSLSWDGETVQGLKHRDTTTGKLSGFQILESEKVDGRNVLIVDDICDGGGTFSALGEVLKGAGASTVHLYVTHGIFSKGTPIPNVDWIYTTDSYGSHEPGTYDHLIVDKWGF